MMTKSRVLPQVQLASEGCVIYMIHYGEYEDKVTYGPYLGKQGMNFNVLAEEYRADRYAAAEQAEDDYCSLSESDFVDWLLANGHLSIISASHHEIEIRVPYDQAYVPKHWPECPRCGDGRGELEYGAVRPSLNRVATFRRCTECLYEWSHSEAAHDSRLPMLPDDGRDTVGGCVPFAISKACGLPFMEVQKSCALHGWSEAGGMHQANAVVAARDLGFDLVPITLLGVGTAKPPTLKQLVASLPTNRNYVIGIKQHWLALVGGQIVDNDANSGRGSRVVELYEVRAIRAFAA